MDTWVHCHCCKAAVVGPAAAHIVVDGLEDIPGEDLVAAHIVRSLEEGLQVVDIADPCSDYCNTRRLDLAAPS